MRKGQSEKRPQRSLVGRMSAVGCNSEKAGLVPRVVLFPEVPWAWAGHPLAAGAIGSLTGQVWVDRLFLRTEAYSSFCEQEWAPMVAQRDSSVGWCFSVSEEQSRANRMT